MTAKPVLRSFAGGEIAEELFGRIDLDKFQSGVAMARDFLVLPHGPLQARPGFEYVLETKDSTRASRIIAFTWSVEQTAFIELGHLYARFHVEGATLLDASAALVVTGVTAANPAVVTYTGTDPANGTWMYLADIVGMTELNGRFVKVTNVNAGANTFEAYGIEGDPVDSRDYVAYASGGTVTPVYEVATTFSEDMLFDLRYTQSADVMTFTHNESLVYELRRLGAANWQFSTADYGPVTDVPTVVTAVNTGAGAVDYTYAVTALGAETFEESLGSTPDTCTNDLTVTGQYNTITWVAPVATPAVGFNVYKYKGDTGGYVGRVSASTLSFIDDNIVPDMSKAPPEMVAPFGGAGDYPTCVTYFGQRRCFAATDNRPQNVWMTRAGTEGNFWQNVPLQDDDAIIFGIKGTQQNRITHLVPMTDLVALTAGGVYVIRAADGTVLTPSSVDPVSISSVGASKVRPALADVACLYVQAQGAHVREILQGSSNNSQAGYTNNDISLLAPHLFDGYSINDQAFANTSTLPVDWVVRDDGVLLGMTYVPSQNVRAWHQHTTQGVFESVACAPEGAEFALYAIVRREINGRSVRYVERLHERAYAAIEDVFAVDSGVAYSGPPEDTFYAWHLKGEAVVGLADGAVVSAEVDQQGTVVLDRTASKVCLGLAYTPRMETLPVSLVASSGFGQGSVKAVNKAHVRVKASGGFFVGPKNGRMAETRWRTTETYDAPPSLRSGYTGVVLDPLWSTDAAVAIEQRTPLPLEILSMVLEVVEGG